jgi:hypothetical protein
MLPNEGVHAGKQKLNAMNNEIVRRVEARGRIDRGKAFMILNSPIPGISSTKFSSGGQYTCTIATVPADLAIIQGSSGRSGNCRGLALPRLIVANYKVMRARKRARPESGVFELLK